MPEMRCRRCDGTGRLTNSHRCPECDGHPPQFGECPRCDSEGWLSLESRCEACSGDGTLQVDYAP